MRARQAVLLTGACVALCPVAARLPAQQASATSAPAQTTFAGGTITGTAVAGKTPLPGVAITATNTLTGKRYATTTDINGRFQMAIPKTGRYVVRAELSAFAPMTAEVKLTAEANAQTAQFTLELASRAAAAQAAAGDATSGAIRQIASALSRGTQNLSLSGDSGLEAATAGGGEQGTSLPSLGGGEAAGGDSISFNGTQGTTNGLAGLSEDQVRDRINDITSQIRAQGGNASDGLNGAASVLSGLMQGGGFGPGGGGRGGGRGGGGRGGGGGGFRGFDPATPHGSIFYIGGFPSLQAQHSSATSLLALSEGQARTSQPVQSSDQNRFGVSFTGSPYIPHLTKPNPKIFTFFNLTGQRNITPENFTGTVPTAAEHMGDLSALAQTTQNGVITTPVIYNPATGTPFQNNQVPITPQAAALLALYPLPNVSGATTQNYQTVTTAGSNSLQGSLRFVENFGKAANQGIGGFLRSATRNGPPSLRQNVNVNFSFSHNASDQRNIIPILGGKTATDGYNLSGGYTAGYGRLVNNATLTWNRSSTVTRNFFTGTNNFAGTNGITVPTGSAQLPQLGFYDGVPTISLSNFTSLSNTVPRDSINQTISFSDFVGYSHKKHNMRYGLDVRRVHADQEGGNNPLGQFSFSGLVTESPCDRSTTLGPTPGCTTTPSTTVTTGSSLADFLLGLPQQSTIQAGLFKTYLRANIFDAYAQDDFRIKPNVTLNYGLRYEYFSPYIEKNNRLVNLDTNSSFTAVDPVQPGQTGTFNGAYPRSLVNPDRTLFSPRFGVAWRPKLPTKALSDIVIRAGYGINFNTGQNAVAAQSLAFQPPFAATQNNTLSTSTNLTGCVIEQPGIAQNLTLTNGFGCSTKPITNNYAVNKNYRLGHVQVYNVDVQKSLPHGIVVNLGYNGSKGGDLDVVLAPNALVNSTSTANAQAFTYEDSQAESRLQQLTLSARKRLERGVSLQLLYVYSHSIDDASSIGGGSSTTVQNSRALNLEESNSSFDIRHALTGNYVYELPFGPNRAFFSKGGRVSKILDGFNISGDFTFKSGTYFTPEYQDSAAELAAGGTYTLRPDRVAGQAIKGPRNITQWFNKAAFTNPVDAGGNVHFGNASRNSIEGPGTIQSDLSLSRTVPLGEQRTFEARFTGTNIFNTVQYSGIGNIVNVATYGQVTSTASARVVTLTARYRF